MLGALLLPPPDQRERKFLSHFFAEQLPYFRFRIEYRLLLAVAGCPTISACRSYRKGDRALGRGRMERISREVHRSKSRSARRSTCSRKRIIGPIVSRPTSRSRTEAVIFWVRVRRPCRVYGPGRVHVSAFADPRSVPRDPHYSLRDPERAHRDQAGMAPPMARLQAACGAVRPMRSLKLLGIAAPDPPGTETNPVPRRSIDSYASGIWKAMGCPAGAIQFDDCRTLGAFGCRPRDWTARSAITSATRK